MCLLGENRADDGAHSQNEKLDVNQFINGIKLVGEYLEEFAAGGGRKSAASGSADATSAAPPPAAAAGGGGPASKRRRKEVRPSWAANSWGMCGNISAPGGCKCCF